MGEAAGQGEAVHDGHPNVGDDETELSDQRARERQRLLAVGGSEHPIARVGQRARQDGTEAGIVVDDEYHCTRLRGRGRHSSCALLRG